MLELTAMAGDDPGFLDIASCLIAGAARASGFAALTVAHIDHWFGPRWLGFCGKLLGAAGVRSRRLRGPRWLTGSLAPPPFHPHRVRSVREYHFAKSQTFEYVGDDRWLHSFRPSQTNINLSLFPCYLYAWYSGDTAETAKGVVMVYAVHWKWNSAWYVGFDKAPDWRLSTTVAVAPRRVQQLLKEGRSVLELS